MNDDRRLVPLVLVKVADLGRDMRDAMAEAVRRHVDFFHEGWK